MEQVSLVFPIPPRPWQRRLDALLTVRGAVPMRCNICSCWGMSTVDRGNVRESLYCRPCGAFNRQRQVARVLMDRGVASRTHSNLKEFARTERIRICNTESQGALHNALRDLPGYVATEFFGPGHVGGDLVDGIRHEDLQELSFGDETFDLMISSDVLEHVPEPYRAHQEIFRVLRPGGHHVFTVPFNSGAARDDVRARPGPSGEPEFLAEPEYHGDPQNPQLGILVYTIFGMELLSNLEGIGFQPRVHRVHSNLAGIYGDNGFVFDAAKPPS